MVVHWGRRYVNAAEVQLSGPNEWNFMVCWDGLEDFSGGRWTQPPGSTVVGQSNGPVGGVCTAF